MNVPSSEEWTTVILTLLKVVGVILTGIFGLLKTAHRFENPDGSLTNWGRRNRAGLALGIALTIGVEGLQYYRARSDAEKGISLAKTAEEQARQLIENTAKAVKQLETVQVAIGKNAEQSAEVSTSLLATTRETYAASRDIVKTSNLMLRIQEPLEPLKIVLRLRVPLKVSAEYRTPEHDLYKYASDIEAFRKRLSDSYPGNAVAICRSCQSYPSEAEEGASELVKAHVFMHLDFFPRNKAGQFPTDLANSAPDIRTSLSLDVAGLDELASVAAETRSSSGKSDFHTRTVFVRDNAGGLDQQDLVLVYHPKVVAGIEVEGKTPFHSLVDILDHRLLVSISSFGLWIPPVFRDNLKVDLLQIQTPTRTVALITGDAKRVKLKKYVGDERGITFAVDIPRSLADIPR